MRCRSARPAQSLVPSASFACRWQLLRGQLCPLRPFMSQEPAAGGVEAVIGVIHCVVNAAADALAAAGGAAGRSASSTEGASGGEAGDAPLLQQLRTAWAALDAAVPVVGLSAVLRSILPPARTLAAALLDWWRRPSVQQQLQLEAAQAAAARSCAYLRCANLGGGGGPAARQGEGSQRCR